LLTSALFNIKCLKSHKDQSKEGIK